MPLDLIEFPADDLARARRFWETLLNVSLDERTEGEGQGLRTHAAHPSFGLHVRGRGPGDRYSLPYFRVPDLTQALERLVELGGTIVHTGERWAICRDSEGSPFGLAGGVGERGSTRREERTMTGKSDFSSEEWALILQGPPTAAVMVVTAERGGTFRETLALTKSYVEARRHHGESELLDEIVSAKPQLDHTHYATPEELREHGLQHLSDAAALLERKSRAEEVDTYKRFVINLATSVAGAHREHGAAITDKEQAMVDEIANALGVEATQ